MKIAIVFNKIKRPDTTGVYCLRALSKKHEVAHFQPEELANIYPDQFDLLMHQ